MPQIKQQTMHSHEAIGPKDACTYNVGDLVWAKVRTHPWWPAQIFDVAFASDLAKRHQRPGQVLVAFFGDQKFAWLNPSSVLPLEPNFEALAGHKRTRSFSFALEELFYEIQRRAEISISCRCTKVLKGSRTLDMETEWYASYSQSQLNVTVNRKDLDVYKIVRFIKEIGCSWFSDCDPNIETSTLHGYVLGIRNGLCKANVVMDNMKKCDDSKDANFRTFQKAKRQLNISLGDDVDAIRRQYPRVDCSHRFGISFGHCRSAIFHSSRGWCNGIDGKDKLPSDRSSDNTAREYDMHELLLLALKQKNVGNKGGLLMTNKEEMVGIVSEASPLIKESTIFPSLATENMCTSQIQTDTTNKLVSSQTPTCLFIKFPPNYQLPSENWLNSTFMLFGALQTDQTRVWKDTSSAQVVFVQGHDAEIAYKYAKENMVSDNENITFRLRHFSNS